MIEESIYVTFDKSNPLFVEVEVIDYAGILKKKYLEYNNQNKYQDKVQEEDQSITEETQVEEVNMEHQDLPKEGKSAKDNPIQMSLKIFLRELQLNTPVSRYVIIWFLFPKLRQRKFIRSSSTNIGLLLRKKS